MKKVIWSWFVLANLFCFVTTFANLSLPWMPETSNIEQQERVSDAGFLTQSALGGAAGSYIGLLLAKRLSSPADEYLRMSLYLLMAQNAAAYIIALTLAWRLRVWRAAGQAPRAKRTSAAAPDLGTGGYREASA